MLLNRILQFKLKEECIQDKYPLDAFVIDKTGIGSIENYQNEEMPASDFCHIIKEKESVYSDCSKMLYAFPYTDEMNGYKLIPITDMNRDEIYAEFKEKGFVYEKSQSAMHETLNAAMNEEALNKDNASNEKVASPQTCFSLVFSGDFSCIIDLLHDYWG